MIQLSAEAHAWIKALHIISVIAWMAGMLYLPRLFAYHTDAEPGSAQSETFKVMERRLLRGIINPSMIAALVFGVLLIVASPFGVLQTGWFWIKVVALVAMLRQARARRAMLSRRRSWRWLSETVRCDASGAFTWSPGTGG